MAKKEVYLEKLEAQLKEWKAKIEILGEKAAKATGETKIELTKEIKELRLKRETVKEKWSELQKASDVAWDAIKEGAEKAVAELKNALDRIVSKLK